MKGFRMKKLLILAGVIAITCSTQVFANENAPQDRPCSKEQAQLERPVQAPHCRPIHKPKHNFKRFEDELNLTTKQKEQAKALREKHMEAAKPLFEQLKTKEQEAQALREQLRELRVQNKKEFEAILTDKQLKKLNEIKAEHKQKFDQHRRGNFHKRPPMPPQCKCDKKAPIEE